MTCFPLSTSRELQNDEKDRQNHNIVFIFRTHICKRILPSQCALFWPQATPAKKCYCHINIPACRQGYDFIDFLRFYSLKINGALRAF
jgi:hypothetical protein